MNPSSPPSTDSLPLPPPRAFASDELLLLRALAANCLTQNAETTLASAHNLLEALICSHPHARASYLVSRIAGAAAGFLAKRMMTVDHYGEPMMQRHYATPLFLALRSCFADRKIYANRNIKFAIDYPSVDPALSGSLQFLLPELQGIHYRNRPSLEPGEAMLKCLQSRAAFELLLSFPIAQIQEDSAFALLRDGIGMSPSNSAVSEAFAATLHELADLCRERSPAGHACCLWLGTLTDTQWDNARTHGLVVLARSLAEAREISQIAQPAGLNDQSAKRCL